MISIMAGLYTQIQNLKKRLKRLDTSKRNQKEVKEVVEALNALEERYDKEKSKRKERQEAKAKESTPSTEEVKVEAVVETDASTDKEANPKCALCGNISFPTWDAYQSHLSEVHQRAPHKEYTPMDPAHKKDIVKDVEHKLGPALISEKEQPKAELYKYSVDEKVEPIRGEKSVGRVMRHDKYVRNKQTGKEGIIISNE